MNQKFYLYLPNDYDVIGIFKSGYSTLASISVDFLKHYIVPDNDIPWKHAYSIHKLSKRNNSKIIMVWRDPIERFISLYKDLCTKFNYHIGISDNTKNKNDQEIFNYYIEKYINKCFINKDDHTQLISPNINYDEVDIIVKLEDLDYFIKHELNYDMSKYKRRNVSKQNIDVSGFDKYKQFLLNYYKEDYKNIEKFKHKIYQRNK